MSNHLRAYFSDSAFIRNKDNANFVAKSYMMAQKICENTGFMNITDIYASDICLIDDQGYIDDIECTKLNYDNVLIEEAKELYLKEHSK